MVPNYDHDTLLPLASEHIINTLLLRYFEHYTTYKDRFALWVLNGITIVDWIGATIFECDELTIKTYYDSTTWTDQILGVVYDDAHRDWLNAPTSPVGEALNYYLEHQNFGGWLNDPDRDPLNRAWVLWVAWQMYRDALVDTVYRCREKGVRDNGYVFD